MIELTLTVNTDNVIGVKETLKEYFDRYGDTRVIKIREIEPEQTRLEERK